MPLSAFVVEYIIRAERIQRRNGDVIWAYMVKWRNDGYFNYSREDESHPCFEHDRTLLDDFWASTGFAPDDYDHLGAVIEPPTFYIEKCKAKSNTGLADEHASSTVHARSPEENTIYKRTSIVLDDDSDDGETFVEVDPSSVPQPDASHHCDSLFGDSDYITATSQPSKLAQSTHSTTSPVELASLAASQSQPQVIRPPRKEGILGPRTVSVMTYDKKTACLVTVKRNQKSLDYQNPPSPPATSLRITPVQLSPSAVSPSTIQLRSPTEQLPPPTAKTLLDLSGYSQDEAAALPDFDAVDVDFGYSSGSPLPQTEQFGPPELGIDDDNLYVPHDITMTITSLDHGDPHEWQWSGVTTGNIDDTLSVSFPLTISVNDHVDSWREAISLDPPLLTNVSDPGPVSCASNSPQVEFESAKPDCPGFDLVFSATHVFPLVLKDVASSTFGGHLFTSLSLPLYGCYAHNDIQTVITDWRESDICDTAKVCLKDCGIMNTHKEQWDTLHEELFQKKLCLITFLPDKADALIIFSSQSKSFGKAVGANSRRLGWANTIIACCVKITSHSIPFEKQSCGGLM